jgi:uncharacterized protein (UPF0276 family)
MPARAGIGLRAQHHLRVLSESPTVGWFEAHTENYFADGGAHVEVLTRIREHYPLSLHGVGLSLGSTDEIDLVTLAACAPRAALRFEPQLLSEHLSWSSVDGRFANDLLPLPYTDEALRHVSTRIAQTQDYLGRQILVENVSSYLQFDCSRMPEWEFLAGVAAESGCAILLDLNNIYVAAQNFGFEPQHYMNAIEPGSVKEIHLAGHSRVDVDGTTAADRHPWQRGMRCRVGTVSRGAAAFRRGAHLDRMGYGHPGARGTAGRSRQGRRGPGGCPCTRCVNCSGA